MKVLRICFMLLLLTFIGYNLLTIPVLSSPVLLWDVSELRHRGNRIWLLESRPVDASTRSYGVTAAKGGNAVDFWVTDQEIQGNLNLFYNWDTYRSTGSLLRKDVILNGVIWAGAVAVFGLVLPSKGRTSYLIATRVSGIVSAIAVFGLLSDQLLYRSAVVSFLPSAGWGLVLPVVGLVLDRAVGRHAIHLAFLDILDGMLDQMILAMGGYSLLALADHYYPIRGLLPW